jgi:hypothetical protein
MTDALWAGAISQAGYSVPAATLAALKAGADMAMIQASDWQNTLSALEQAVGNGTLSLVAVDASVTRILAAKGVQVCTTDVAVAVTGTPTARALLPFTARALRPPKPAKPVFWSGTASVFWSGAARNLYQALGSAAGALQGPNALGMGPLGSTPAAGVDANGATYVYWKGADNNLWEAYWDGAQWTGPFNRGMGPLESPPAVAISPSGSAYVFWEGADANLWEAMGPANGMLQGPMRIGMGPLGSPPTASVDRTGATYVYWKGTDRNLWEAYWNGTSWAGPFNRGMGPLGSMPSLAMTPGALSYVFWEGTDHNLWEAQGPAKQALSGPFNRRMGPLNSAPTAGIDGSGAAYVYWIGTDNDLWEGYWSWSASAWVGPFNRGMGPLRRNLIPIPPSQLPPNYLRVTVVRASCFPGKPYPTLYFTNTYPRNSATMIWDATTSDPRAYLHGGSGNVLNGGETEPVEILTTNATPSALTVTVNAGNPSSYPVPVPGYWQGTIQPCQ